MKLKSSLQGDELVLNRLYENQVNYFSYTLFKNDKPTISHCNNSEWLGFYREKYGMDNPPPVQKYILHSRLSILPWDLVSFDSYTAEYIKARNNVVGVSNNISLVFRNNEYLSVITLGTSKGSEHLINLLNDEPRILHLIKDNFFL